MRWRPPATLICGPGTDPDRFQQYIDSVVGTAETGAQVQGEINLGANTIATVDGDIIVSGNAESALQLTETTNVVINGFVGGDAPFDGFTITITITGTDTGGRTPLPNHRAVMTAIN